MMVRDITIELRLCMFILNSSSLASRIPVVQFLPMAVQLTFELELRQTQYKNEKNGTVIAISVL